MWCQIRECRETWLKLVVWLFLCIGITVLTSCEKDSDFHGEVNAPGLEELKTSNNLGELAASSGGSNPVFATAIPGNLNSQKKLLRRLETEKMALSSSDERLLLFLRYAVLVNSEHLEKEKMLILIEDIKKRLKQGEGDDELTALLGSATSYTAVFYPQDTGKQQLLAKKGIRLLDKAIKSSPNNLGVRLQRGITYSAMPAFLGKSSTAIEDLKYVKQFYREDSGLIFMINFYLGKALINNAEKSAGIELLQQLAKEKIQPWSSKAEQIIRERG